MVVYRQIYMVITKYIYTFHKITFHIYAYMYWSWYLICGSVLQTVCLIKGVIESGMQLRYLKRFICPL